MASFILIEFDRTKPEFEIYAPRYTTSETMTVITIEAKEALSTYQEFYVIDAEETRHDYTFHQENDYTYTGRIRFNTVPLGILKIYARVRDEVDNVSDLLYKTMEIREDIPFLTIDAAITARTVTVADNLPYDWRATHRVTAIDVKG